MKTSSGLKKNKKREITLGRVEWAQGDMVAAVGTVRCGCKSSIPQKPECFRSHSEGPMTETQWELGVNNYPTWEAIAACTSPGLTCKNSDGLNPCLHPHWPKHKVFGRFGGLHSSGALPALPSTRMCIRSLSTPPGSCMIVSHILDTTSAEYYRKYQYHLPQRFFTVWLRGHSMLLLHICGEGLQLCWELLWKNLDRCWHLHSLTRYLTHSLQAFPVKILKSGEVFSIDLNVRPAWKMTLVWNPS